MAGTDGARQAAVMFGALAQVGASLRAVTPHPARGWADRLLVHTPVALYAGWVSVAVVVGAASTGAALGAGVSGAGDDVLAVAAIAVTAGITVVVLRTARAVLGYAVAVVWALAGIAVAGASVSVVVASVVAAALVASAAVVLVRTAARPARAALG
jgi:benzodiazapine receptor